MKALRFALLFLLALFCLLSVEAWASGRNPGKRILVLGGSGRIGRAVAFDLERNPRVGVVGLADINGQALKKTRAWLGGNKTRTHRVDLTDRTALTGLLKKYDVAVIALPTRKLSYTAVEAAIEAKTHAVDILEEYHRRPDKYETEGLDFRGLTPEQFGEDLHRRAQRAGVLILDGMGFAPGLSNITVGEGLRQTPGAHSAVARVGGIPDRQTAGRHPLGYVVTWSFEHVLREYNVKVDVRRGGRTREVEAMSELERFRFDAFGLDEQLECFITPGMPSFPHTRPELRDFAEKTIRWPGHHQGISTLKQLGLLETAPVEHRGRLVVPRELTLQLLEPRLTPRPGDRDVCAMYNTVWGKQGGREARTDYFMWAKDDPKRGITAMGRATGFTAAIAAALIADGTIDARGIVAPEDAVAGPVYRRFIEELAKRQLKIAERSIR